MAPDVGLAHSRGAEAPTSQGGSPGARAPSVDPGTPGPGPGSGPPHLGNMPTHLPLFSHLRNVINYLSHPSDQPGQCLRQRAP